MKFQLLLEDLIMELSGDEIHKKYYSKIPYDVFVSIVEADPKSIVTAGTIQKIGKWCKLLINLYQKGTLQLEDLYKATEYLEYVYLHNIQVDVAKVKSLGDLYNIVKQYILEDKKEFNDVLEMLPENEYDKIYDGSVWDIYVPKTERAACWLGVNTEWCTQWGPLSLNKKHRDRSNQYSRYSKPNDPLYILVDKNNPLHKYQFNFGSKQFMDVSDKRINHDNFFNSEINREILYYFFPSMHKEVDEKQLQSEFKIADILPANLLQILINKIVGSSKNYLVNAIKYGNQDELNVAIKSDKIIDEPQIKNGYLVLSVNDIEGDLYNFSEVIDYYHSDIDSSWQRVYDDTKDRGYSDFEDEFQDIFKKYYEDTFSKSYDLKHIDYKKFYDAYFKMWIDSEDIMDDFATDVADSSYESFQELHQAEINNASKHLIVDLRYNGEYDIKIGVGDFLMFVLKKDYQIISDEGNTLFSVLEDYIDYLNLPTEYENLYDYQITYPKYDERNYISKNIDGFFEKIIDNPESERNCRENTFNFSKIKNKYFNNYSYEYDVKNQFKVRIVPNSFNCEENTVLVYYYKKDDKDSYVEDYKGKVKIDNLVPLLTNYKLFESRKLSLLSLIF